MAELRSAIFWVLNCPIYLLRCYNRKKRYENLFDQASWNEGYSNVISKTKKLTIVNVFEKYILGESQQTVNFRDLQRIKMLLAMLSWTDSPSHEQTRYMEIKRDTSKPYIGNRTNKKEKNEYSERPILPDPLQIIKEANDKLRKGNSDFSTNGSNGSKAWERPKKKN